ncbi:hypothetical protein, partial [Bacillus cereus]
VFEDTTWWFTRHRGKLQYFTDFAWSDSEYRIVISPGVKKLYVDLYTADVRRMTLTVDMIDAPITELERFAFGSVIYYLSQATSLVDAIQEPLPFWQH